MGVAPGSDRDLQAIPLHHPAGGMQYIHVTGPIRLRVERSLHHQRATVTIADQSRPTVNALEVELKFRSPTIVDCIVCLVDPYAMHDVLQINITDSELA